ncbi:MAG: nucleotide exchange factor GrpE, partial [Caldilineaceae bacterium]|nr:nucleotide exchange factor GrpE [Caldilineaceae bacterium]
ADTSQPDPEVLIGEAPAADSATKGEEEVPVNAADAVAETAEEPSEAQVIEELRAQLAAAEQKNAELVDNLQRTAAEFQNSRRRQEKQLSDAIERAGGHVVERLLPVMDDLTLAFSNLPEELDETTNAWVDGFRQIRKKLEGMLSDQGVTTIPLDGEFDPNRHEAISSEPSESVESGHIIETLRVGYEYKGRVLRPALVRVAM